jgi:NAD(P)-dependent dehydrogenase (short-subunit alcohol dehydrogenase family)
LKATKHALQGLTRSLRKPLYEKEKIRINVVCPGMTDSQMTDGIVQTFYKHNLAVNVPDDLATVILALLTETELYGKGIYVEGARAWEIEDGLVKTMPQWLGEGPTTRLWDGLRIVASVCLYFAKYMRLSWANEI